MSEPATNDLNRDSGTECANAGSLHVMVGPSGFRSTVKTKADPYKAADGKHYWNCWTNNYQVSRDGYCQHAFCEEDRTGKTLCGVVSREGGGISIPNELDKPSCLKCRAIMLKRGALRPNAGTHAPRKENL